MLSLIQFSTPSPNLPLSGKILSAYSLLQNMQTVINIESSSFCSFIHSGVAPRSPPSCGFSPIFSRSATLSPGSSNTINPLSTNENSSTGIPSPMFW
jgi:hypothetical protein